MKNSDNRTENSEIFKNAPKTEPERQYYFIEQLKKIVEKKSGAGCVRMGDCALCGQHGGNDEPRSFSHWAEHRLGGKG